MMLREGAVDGVVTGLTRTYPEAIRPALEIVRTQQGRRASGTYIVAFKESLKLFADCTVNAEPTAEELADIAISTAELARAFELTPRIAMLSYSNFGTDRGGSPAKVRRAGELGRAPPPGPEVEGEMQGGPAGGGPGPGTGIPLPGPGGGGEGLHLQSDRATADTPP